ncbi:YcnI family protein [Massilia sp. DJPM01]|uniref:YcnI family protein n=1 Tax=Massilia sp. DJPM01 TaxID=3024404 RepID=UPI00259F63AF|nr:YcnI family protein [Massilia sp. DJPM01]MDM5178321.1 YcnI family protein [Massilia sp. DJPM01]
MNIRILFACVALAAPLAHAHVTLEQTSASAGTYQKLTFRVGHGCKGSPTHTLSVTLPAGVEGAKPMPKAGWTLSGTARQLTWKGGPLADAHFDEFAMQVKLPATAGKYYFKVSQLCDEGRLDWDAIPDASGARPASPAPVLEIVPAAAGAPHH